MAANNWRPNEQVGETRMDASDWRAQMPSDLRQKVLDTIVGRLKDHLPSSGPKEINQLRQLAVKFEEKTYFAATDQTDYLRKISLKMFTVGNKTQNAPSSNLQSGSSAYTNIPPDPVQVVNQGQPFQTSLPANGTPSNQQLLSQSIQSNVNIPGSAGLPQATIPGVVAQNANIQNSSGAQHARFSMGEGVPTNMLAGSQRQMQGRPQVLPQQQPQQQPQSSNYMYLQQMQQQLPKQKLQGNLRPLHMQQQQQHNQSSVQTIQQQTPQQTSSIMQHPFVQSAASSGLPSGQQSFIQQHPQSVRRQQHQSQQDPSIDQQHMPMPQQMIPSQEQQQQGQEELMGQRMTGSETQRNHLVGQQNSEDLQQQAYRLSSQQNNIASLQQRQQQQSMLRQTNLQNIHQQRLGPQSNASALPSQQQQNMLGSQSGNFNMLSNQHAANSSQQSKVPVQNYVQQPGSGLLTTQGLQSRQSQVPHQRMVMQPVQSQQPVQQQQLGLQQHLNSVQHDMQQRFEGAGPVLQAQNIADQQKQMYQSQRAPPENSSTSQDSAGKTGSASGGDWQEELYQKINALKEMYLPDLTAVLQKITFKLQQIDSLPQQQTPDPQMEKMRIFKLMLERIIDFVTVPRSSVSEGHRERISGYEKQILHFLKNQRPRKPMLQGQPPHSQMHPMQQTTQSPSLLSGLSTSQPSMLHLHSSQMGFKVESGGENTIGSSQNVALTSLQQNPVNTSRLLHPNISLVQSRSSMLQQQHLKQQQEQPQHIVQNQQQKQLQQRQIQQQAMQRQQLIQQQQLQQQAKQQLQMPSPHQANSTNDLRMRQGMNIQAGLLQQHLSLNQRQLPSLQQSKPVGAQLSNSSPHLPLTASPQMPQLSSPQLDQQNLPATGHKTGTPSQSAGSPFVVPSPITPFAPSPMPGDPEKPISIESPLPHATDVKHPQTTGIQAAVRSPSSFAVVKPFPSLSESVHLGTSANIPETLPPKQSVERPIDRLIKAFQSSSSKSLAESVSEMSLVVSMVDKIAASAPSDGSRAAIGEDLVAMTKCRLQARNFMTHEGANVTKKMKRSLSPLPFDSASSMGGAGDGYKQFGRPEPEMDSTASSCMKRQKIEPDRALLREIKEINQRLIDTVVDICEDDVNPSRATSAERGGGTVVTCSYAAVALSPTFKAHYVSGQISQIQPLRLLIPANYPDSSPILLDKFPMEASKDYEDLSVKTKSRFSLSLKSLSEPMSLKDIARTWDACARAAILEYARGCGGGDFSSKFGSWESCLSAS